MKPKKIILAIAGLMLLPALYLYLMFDIRRPDPIAGKTVRHCKHVAVAYDMYCEIFTNMHAVVTESATDVEDASRQVIQALTGKHPEANPYGTAFMEDPSPGMKNPGFFPDHWNKQYLVRLDDNGDGKINMGKHSVKGRVIVWSCGPDGINDWARNDDISYKQ